MIRVEFKDGDYEIFNADKYEIDADDKVVYLFKDEILDVGFASIDEVKYINFIGDEECLG